MKEHLQSGPRPRPGILEIERYVGGESSVAGRNRVIKLSSNESPFGASPMATEAYKVAAAELALYPDGSAGELRHALARTHGLEADRIVAGNGSDELLTLLAHAYLSPGDEAIMTEYSFVVYRIATLSANARPVLTPEPNYRPDIDAMIRALTPRTKLVYLANPGNPTGTHVPKAEVERLHAALPSDVLLVLDAAYAEFATASDYEAGVSLVKAHSNVVMTRTFSKLHGLAALRLGWCYAPPAVADVLGRTRCPFNVNRSAQAAGIAALADKAHAQRSLDHNAEWLGWVTREISALGIHVVPSQCNFVMLDFKALGEGAAAAADAALKAEGLILRGLAGGYGLPNALRMTIGTQEANRAVVGVLTKFVQERRKA